MGATAARCIYSISALSSDSPGPYYEAFPTEFPYYRAFRSGHGTGRRTKRPGSRAETRAAGRPQRRGRWRGVRFSPAAFSPLALEGHRTATQEFHGVVAGPLRTNPGDRRMEDSAIPVAMDVHRP